MESLMSQPTSLNLRHPPDYQIKSSNNVKGMKGYMYDTMSMEYTDKNKLFN